MSIKFGLYTICRYDDGFEEPEGTVIYDELPPKIGTEVVLCDKRTWIVTEIDKEYSKVYVARKESENDSTRTDNGSCTTRLL
jgi:hypothetical protein